MARNKAASKALAAIDANPGLLKELSLVRESQPSPDSKLQLHQNQYKLKMQQRANDKDKNKDMNVKKNNGNKEASTNGARDSNQNYRGEVSLVHELAMMLKLKVNFQVSFQHITFIYITLLC